MLLCSVFVINYPAGHEHGSVVATTGVALRCLGWLHERWRDDKLRVQIETHSRVKEHESFRGRARFDGACRTRVGKTPEAPPSLTNAALSLSCNDKSPSSRSSSYEYSLRLARTRDLADRYKSPSIYRIPSPEKEKQTRVKGESHHWFRYN